MAMENLLSPPTFFEPGPDEAETRDGSTPTAR
jgi:hypothetical protein